MLMIAIDVPYHLLVKKLFLNKVLIIGAKGQIFEITKPIFLLNYEHILDPNAKSLFFVIPRLVSNYHPWHKFDIIDSTNPYRRLMDPTKVTHSMSCAMVVVPSLLPKMPSRQNIDICAC